MKTNTVIRAMLLAIVLVFVGHQFYSSVYKPVKTETAVYYDMIDGLNITATIVRNEYLVTCDTDGVYHYIIDDGARVAKGGIIANIYDSENASLTMTELNYVTDRINDINDLTNYNNQQATDIDLLKNRVNTSLSSLISGCSSGNYSAATSDSDALLSALNRRQFITGENIDFSANLAELNDRLSKLQASLPTAKGKVYAKESGYFSPTTDGLESVLKTDNLESITVDFMKNLAPQPISDNVVGKIVSDYEWYIAAKVTLNESMQYKIGDKLTVKTSLKSTPMLDVTVSKINISKDSDSAVIVLSCNQMSKELASMRTGAMTIVNKTYSGLRVSKSALRVADSKTVGVYVLSGITLDFVPINILYSNDEFMICEQQQTNDKALRLYDNVIVKGKNLYDGKVVG